MEIYLGNYEDVNTLTGILVRNGYVVSAQPLMSDNKQSWVVKTHDVKERSNIMFGVDQKEIDSRISYEG